MVEDVNSAHMAGQEKIVDLCRSAEPSDRLWWNCAGANDQACDDADGQRNGRRLKRLWSRLDLMPACKPGANRTLRDQLALWRFADQFVDIERPRDQQPPSPYLRIQICGIPDDLALRFFDLFLPCFLGFHSGLQ